MERMLECTCCGKKFQADSKICPFCREVYDENRIPFSPLSSGAAPAASRKQKGHYERNGRKPATDASVESGDVQPAYALSILSGGQAPSVGEITAFGTWTQDGADPEPILWRVMEIRGNAALLLSERALSVQPYHKEQELVSWKECSLRKWLNGAFYNTAFDKLERSYVVRAVMPDLDYHNAREPNTPSYDAVFLPSASEAKEFFPSKADRAAMPTDQTLRSGAFTDPSTGACRWWLRSPRNYDRGAQFVDTDGSLCLKGTNMARTTICVRPALYIRFGSQG